MDAAIWGAELSAGEGRGRIYRTKQPLRVLDEVLYWKGHPPEQLRQMLDSLDELKRQGIEAIND